MKTSFLRKRKCRAAAPGAFAFALALAACAPSGAWSSVALRKSLANLAEKDTVCKVWVIFTDKTSAPGAGHAAPKALARRRRAAIHDPAWADAPVSGERIRDVERIGGRCVSIFKWANAASFVFPSRLLPSLARQPFVRDVVPVRVFAAETPRAGSTALRKSGAAAEPLYGSASTQLSILNVPAAHRYLKQKSGTSPGQGVLIGMFDSGFRLRHRCFSRLVNEHRVVADSDFVDRDGTVEDPDSVASNPAHPYNGNDAHGSETLSLIAGFDSLRFTGDAYGARFVLARTEDSPVEKHYEEDYWAAAMVWAESLGVDIVSSSVGYNTGFTPPDTDYTFRDMDGNTTIISKAARQAAAFGVIIVNSMGNGDPFLVAPADVDGVVAVGAVDMNLTIAGFSDNGPTADGLIKPDCVAPGVSDTIPLVYDPYGGYTSGSGTSFAAPLVAGVCALVLQANAGDSAAEVRRRLYSSCFFAPEQDAVNNVYGRGIPDALLAVLADSQTYVIVADSSGRAVAGATLTTTGGATAGTSDGAGYAVVNLSGTPPETLVVTHPAFTDGRVVVPARHSRARVALGKRFALRIVLLDASDSLPVKGTVFWRDSGVGEFSSLAVDSSGVAAIAPVSSSFIEFFAAAPGYFQTEKTKLTLSEIVPAADTIYCNPRPAARFSLYPNPLKQGRNLYFEFSSSPDDPRSYSQVFTAAIRSMDGTLVWKCSGVLEERTPVQRTWLVTTAPGVYYFVLTYGGKTYRKKVFVTG